MGNSVGVFADTLVELAGKITNAADVYSKIREIVFNENLNQILSTLGDVEFEAALDAFKKARMSHRPESEIQACLVHLSTAHISFRKLYDGNSLKRMSLTYKTYIYARNRDIWSCLLRAICYHCRGEHLSFVECLGDVEYAWNHLSNYQFDLADQIGYLMPHRALEWAGYRLGIVKEPDPKWIISYENMQRFFVTMRGCESRCEEEFWNSSGKVYKSFG
jgi:hypothetical protein